MSMFGISEMGDPYPGVDPMPRDEASTAAAYADPQPQVGGCIPEQRGRNYNLARVEAALRCTQPFQVEVNIFDGPFMVYVEAESVDQAYDIVHNAVEGHTIGIEARPWQGTVTLEYARRYWSLDALLRYLVGAAKAKVLDEVKMAAKDPAPTTVLSEKKHMDFGGAICVLKGGGMVRREGWNGKGMYLYLHTGIEVRVGDSTKKCEPVIGMYTAQGRYQPGWLASQADMLGEDWEEV